MMCLKIQSVKGDGLSINCCPLFRLRIQLFFILLLKMEYKILGIRENDSMDAARKALKTIRILYHPDKLISLPALEKEKNKKFLSLAEEAYDVIKKKACRDKCAATHDQSVSFYH